MAMSAVRRGAIITLMYQWGGYFLQIVSLVVLARILAPSDYGLITMAAAVIGVAAIIGDFGLSLAAIQARELSERQKSNLFWLNTVIGVGVGLAVAGAAPLIAGFYGAPRLRDLTVVLAVVFALNGMSVQFKVELNRAGRFGALGGAELAGQASGLATAIVLAVLGAGYWALVFQQVVSAGVRLVAAGALAHWVPGWPGEFRSARSLIAFGRDTLLLQVANYATSNIDSVMIGRFSGTGALGLYNRAYQITLLPITQIISPLTRVFLPWLSAANDEDFPVLLKRLQQVVLYVTLGPLALLCAASDTIPVLLFGERWRGLGDLLPLLSAAAFLGSAGYVYYWAFLARAKTMLLFVAELVGRGPMVVLIVILAPLGPQWVALSLVIGQSLIWLSSSIILRRLGVPVGALVLAVSRPCLLYGGALGAALLARAIMADAVPVLATAGVEIGVFGLVLVGMFFAVRGVRADLTMVARTVRVSRRPPQ